MLCISFYNLFCISFMVWIFPERKVLFLMDLSMDIFQDFLARILGDSISEKLTFSICHLACSFRSSSISSMFSMASSSSILSINAVSASFCALVISG